jgi:hypothetical protein
MALLCELPFVATCNMPLFNIYFKRNPILRSILQEKYRHNLFDIFAYLCYLPLKAYQTDKHSSFIQEEGAYDRNP